MNAFPSFLGHWRNASLSKPLSVDPTGCSSHTRTIRWTLQHLKVLLAEAFIGAGGHYRAILRNLSPSPRRLVPVAGFDESRRISTITDRFCLCLCLGSVQKLALVHPPKKFHHLPRRWLGFELLSDGRCRTFPFHTLSFAFCSVMVDPHLVPITMRLKEASPPLRQPFNRCWQIVKRLCLCAPVNCFGIQVGLG
jgi:hypothetical protein